MDLHNDHIEDIWVEVTDVSSTSFLVGALYSHPNNTTKHFGEILENSINIINMERKTFYLLGDFNINALSKNTVDKRFINNMQSIGAHQMITLPTRFMLHQKPSLLDHIYCNDFVHELQPGVLQYDISDHHPIFLLAKIVPKRNKLTKWKRCYKQFHPEKFAMHLSTNLEENFTSNPENPNEEFNNFFKIFKSSVDHNAPLIKLSRKLTKLASKPWITKGLLNSIKTKNKLYKKAMNSGIASEFQKYRKFNNILTHLKKKAKLNFYKTQLFENSNTPRETWKTINKVIGKNSADNSNSIPIIQKTVPGASSLPHNQSVAQVLNQFFTSVGPSLASAIPSTVTDIYLPPPQICSSMFITPTCSEEILNLINLLDDKKSTDPYDIPVRLVKLSKNIVCTYLADIFNNSVKKRDLS